MDNKDSKQAASIARKGKARKIIIDSGANRMAVVPGWVIISKYKDFFESTPYHRKDGKHPIVDLLLDSTTFQPVGLLLRYNVAYDKKGMAAANRS
jgi:hypothetical protein